MPSIHYPIGGSKIHRLLPCLKSLQFGADAPVRVSGAMTRGTGIHDALEHHLQIMGMLEIENFHVPENFLDAAADLVGATFSGYEITQEDLDTKILPALRALLELMDTFEITYLEAETLLEMDSRTGGSPDIIFQGTYENEYVYGILDWKTGDGNIVEVAGNQQLAFYGALVGAIEETSCLAAGSTQFVGAIIQPCDRLEDPLSFEIRPVAEIEQFLVSIRALSARLKKEDYGEPAEGTHCKWCPGAYKCELKTGAALAAAQLPTAEIENLATALELAHRLKNWITEVEHLAHDQAEKGVRIPGWKLVARRATRQWSAKPEEVIAKFRRKLGGKKEMMSVKLLSPAQLEKLAKQKGAEIDLSEFTTSLSSGTNLARDDDPRSAVLPIQAIAASIGKALKTSDSHQDEK